MYHFSAPMDSLKPSDELSEPLRPRLCNGVRALPELGEVPGDREYGDAECCLVGWNCPAAVCIATVVAPALGACADFVVIVRAADGPVCEEFEDEVDVFPFCEYEVCEAVAVGGDVAAFWMAECARKAERKLPKNGLLVDISNYGGVEVMASYPPYIRVFSSLCCCGVKELEPHGCRCLRRWCQEVDFRSEVPVYSA